MTAERPDEGHESDDSTVQGGRYCYCIVGVSQTGPDEDRSLDVTGVDGETPRLLVADGVGLVVHDCERVPEPDDPTTVRRWLLSHQSVVDATGEAFGTPLPLRFGTVIEGGDEAATDWLRSETDRLTALLDEFDGRWEYRVHLVWDDDRLAEEIDDDRLRELDAEREAADEGRAFLVGKRYEQRLTQVTRARKDEIAQRVERRLAEVGERVERLGPPGAAAREAVKGPTADERFSTLIDADSVESVSASLDEMSAVPGLTVRYTGPWPPYTFTPALGDPP